MIDFALSTLNSDIQIGPNGNCLIVSGIQEVAQRVKMRINWLLGEWFLDTTKGLPWFQSMLGGKDVNTATLLVRSQINDTIGVDSVGTVNVSFAQRKLSIYAVCVIGGQSIPITAGVQIG